MYRRLFIGPLLIWCFFVKGQDQHDVQPPALALHFAFNDFASVPSPQGPSFHEAKAGLAASYIRGLNRRIDITGTAAGSILQFPFRKGLTEEGRQLLLLEGDASLRWKLYPYYHWWSPYLRLGLGVSVYQGRFGSFSPAGIGAQVNLTPYTFFLLDAQYRIPLTEQETGHFFYGLGLGGIIRNKKISVVHKRVLMPVRETAVATENQRSLDSDGDGIPDDKDKCPGTPGWASYDGCPPPSVGDTGVRPRDTAWSVADRLHAAAQRVYFATGKYVLLPVSFPALDEVVRMMKDYPSLKIDIQGHTDSVGDDRDNQLLSQRRAEAVLAYLTGRGVLPQRLKARGYGPFLPIATNVTEEGRALNRRVEFKVHDQ